MTLRYLRAMYLPFAHVQTLELYRMRVLGQQ